jgi:cupin fold WbuC family metalloprotein
MRETKRALFNTATVMPVDDRLIEDLKARARAASSRRFRLCLHASPDDPTQEMVVVHCRDNYSRPHAHDSPLTLLVIEGEMRVLLFDDTGTVTRTVDLAPFGGGKPFALHLTPAQWYMPVCTTQQVVFYETKRGPFDRDTTNRWATWSPAEDDEAGIAAYRRTLGIAFDEA